MNRKIDYLVAYFPIIPAGRTLSSGFSQMQIGYFLLPLWRVVNNSHNFLPLLWAGCQQKGCGQFQIPYPQFNKKHDFKHHAFAYLFSFKGIFYFVKETFFLRIDRDITSSCKFFECCFLSIIKFSRCDDIDSDILITHVSTT